jgi:hypothetical protein
MEASLNKVNINCFKEVYSTRFTREETAESVVPDTMPDIREILSADGMITLRSKEVDAGKISVTANISATVVYLPEKESGVRKLSLIMPFSATVEAPEVDETCPVVACLRLCSIDARMLNPRKILVRADVMTRLNAYCEGEMVVCDRLADDGSAGIQVLTSTKEVSPVTQVGEKTFVLSDEYQIPSSKPPMGELLSPRVELAVDDVKSVGNKLIFKGSARVWLLYANSTDGQPVVAEYTTPFSQIMEMEGIGNQPQARMTLMLTGAYFEPVPTAQEGRVLSAEIHLVAQAVCSDNRNVDYIADAYSNDFALSLKSEDMSLSSIVRRMEIRETIRELIDTDEPVREIINIYPVAGVAMIEDKNVKCPVTVSIIYRSDSGNLCAVTRRFAVEAPMEQLEPGMEAQVLDVRCGEAYASAAAGGLELRLPVDFDILITRKVNIMPITEISVLEDSPIDNQNRPSVIVVCTDGKPDIWALAKKYNSTPELINAANPQKDAEGQSRRMLLIPKAR